MTLIAIIISQEVESEPSASALHNHIEAGSEQPAVETLVISGTVEHQSSEPAAAPIPDPAATVPQQNIDEIVSDSLVGVVEPVQLTTAGGERLSTLNTDRSFE